MVADYASSLSKATAIYCDFDSLMHGWRSHLGSGFRLLGYQQRADRLVASQPASVAPAHQLHKLIYSQQFLLSLKLIGHETRHDSSMRAILLHLEPVMRLSILIFLMLSGVTTSALAQHSQPRRDAVQAQTDINSDAKAEETKQAIERARERQKAADRHNSDLWGRWIYAVCVGCGWTPKNVRIVHTNPSRVLIGIPAAEDDARERASIRLRS